MKITLLLLIVIGITFLGCSESQKKLVESPPLTDSLQAGYNTLNFTIFYPTYDLEDWLNRKLAHVIVDKQIAREQNKDSVRLIITKPKKIRLKTVGDSVDVVFPLHIEIIADKERKSGKVAQRRVTGDLDLHLNIKPDVDIDWNIVSTSILKSHSWVKTPRLIIGNAEIGIKFILDHILNRELNTLTEALDKALEEKVNLKRGLSRTWARLQTPMPIRHQDSSLLYFKIDPRQVAGDIQVTRKGFLFRMAVNNRALVHVDSLSLGQIRPLPPFRNLGTYRPDSNRLEVLATVPLEYINRELIRLLRPYKFENNIMKLTVSDIQMQGSAEKILLKLTVNGTAEGTITVVGQPAYLADQRLLTIRDLNYELETDHPLVNLLDKNLKTHLLNYVRERVILDVGQYITDLPEYLNNTINQGESGDKFHLIFDEIAIENIEYLVNENNFQILLKCRPKFEISLKRLPVRKQLKIR